MDHSFRPVPKPDDADERLARVGPGLSVALIHEGLRRAHLEATEVTANHPRTTFPHRLWEETNRWYRDLLAPFDWTRTDLKKRVDYGGVPRTYCHDRKVAFYATSGNDDTGLPHRIPSTKNPRGTVSSEQIDANQLYLGPQFQPIEIAPETRTWILLYYYVVDRDPMGVITKEMIRSEFSLPVAVENGTITRWKERIILPPLDLVDPGTSPAPEDYDPDIDIHIERRDR